MIVKERKARQWASLLYTIITDIGYVKLEGDRLIIDTEIKLSKKQKGIVGEILEEKRRIKQYEKQEN